jgi:hypothetical protein
MVVDDQDLHRLLRIHTSTSTRTRPVDAAIAADGVPTDRHAERVHALRVRLTV